MTIFDFWEGFEVACVLYTLIRFAEWSGAKCAELEHRNNK